MTRRNFTPTIKRQAFDRSGGVCECHRIPWLNRPNGCGVKLSIGNTFYEHINPDAIRKDASLDNCACLCRTCFFDKTNHYDKSIIAKSNRVRDHARGIRRIPARPLPGTIASGWRKRMDGTVERRK